MTEREKFEKLLEAFGVTSYRLAKDLDIGTERINKVLRGETKNPSVEIYAKIKEVFPKVSSDWLLLGVGEIFMPETPNDDSPHKEELQKLQTEKEFIQGLYEKAMEKLVLQSAGSLKKSKGAILCPDAKKKFRREQVRQVMKLAFRPAAKVKLTSGRVRESKYAPLVSAYLQRVRLQ